MRDPGDHLPAAGGDGLAVAGGDGLAVAGGDGQAVIYTVGHSTRSAPQLIEILETARVDQLVDVRTVPRSRRNPQFNGEALASSLADHGIAYHLERALGGFRRPRPDSPNGGWEHPAFRGYADYMASPEFTAALKRLIAMAGSLATSIMCAEAQWWRCHRRLVADALVVRGWEVLHLGLGPEPVPHELTPFAVVGADWTLTYPPAQEQLALGD
ncbi:MAG TPA: DUF488 domain-containing protein [Solirubrobacteraceae bacterium]